MTASGSVALPLGDAAIFSTSVIITERFPFVNTKMKNFLKSFFFFQYAAKVLRLYGNSDIFAGFWRRIFACEGLKIGFEYGIMTRYAPVAQLDRAQASDAWCRRFESCSVRHKNRGDPIGIPSILMPHSHRFEPRRFATQEQIGLACAGCANDFLDLWRKHRFKILFAPIRTLPFACQSLLPYGIYCR